MKLINIFLIISIALFGLLLAIFIVLLFRPDILSEETDLTLAYITSITALTMVILAIAAFLTVKAADVREQQRWKKETIYRTLKEIIDYALEILTTSTPPSFLRDLEGIGLRAKTRTLQEGLPIEAANELFNEEMDSFDYFKSLETQFDLDTLVKRGKYLNIAARKLDNELFEKMNELTTKAKLHCKLCGSIERHKKDNKLTDKTIDNRRQLNIIATSVIERASYLIMA